MPVKSLFSLMVLAGMASPLCAEPMVSTSTLTMTASSATVSASSWTWRKVTNSVFQPGESFYFTITWGVIHGGYSTLSVQGLETVNGRQAYRIVEEANSSGIVDTFYHVRDRNDAWLDAESLLTVRYSKNIREGKYRIVETVEMDQENHRYSLHSERLDKKTTEDKEGPMAPDVLDVLSSLYYVRTLPLVVGESYTMDVFSGEKVWPLVVKVKKREKVKVPAGKFTCLLVEPLLREPGIFVSKGKKLEVWLTDDERRMPVRMRSEVVIGHVAAELVSFHKVDPPTP